MRSTGVALALAVLWLSACGPKTAPAVAGEARHPDFLFPVVPDGTAARLKARLEVGWRYLQIDDLRAAEREFAAALSARSSFYPAETALGYAALARTNAAGAADRFATALQASPAYVPALVGRGQALVEMGRDAEALASFEAAVKADPSLTDLRGRIEVLRVRATQALLKSATAAAQDGRLADARSAYQEAITASPDSAFLYRELAAVEQLAGESRAALDHYRQAVQLDPTDARAHAAIAGILDAQGDAAGAIAAYERARALDPAEVPADVLARLGRRSAQANLPAAYRQIAGAAAATRGDVAALVGVRLAALVSSVRPREVVITDSRAHWAQVWITAVVRSGIMDTLPNYQFQPDERVRRGDVALVVSRLLTLVADRQPAAARAWQGVRLKIADVGAEHLSYPAVSAAAASGVMPLANGSFNLLGVVTGAEAMEVVTRLETLARLP